jgi:C_GCAxxG_C_C family probable redox protein
MDDFDQMRELQAQGFFCSQIILKLGMELQGKDDTNLIRAVQGLAGGLGFSGELCGALTGGACLLGLYAGKALPEENQDLRLDFMVSDLVKWFKQEYSQSFGGIRCEEIINNNKSNMSARCPVIVASTLQRVKELLVENGFDLEGTDV